VEKKILVENEITVWVVYFMYTSLRANAQLKLFAQTRPFPFIAFLVLIKCMLIKFHIHTHTYSHTLCGYEDLKLMLNSKRIPANDS